MGERGVCTDACRPSLFCIETVRYSRQRFGLGLLLLFILGVLFEIIVFISWLDETICTSWEHMELREVWVTLVDACLGGPLSA